MLAALSLLKETLKKGSREQGSRGRGGSDQQQRQDPGRKYSWLRYEPVPQSEDHNDDSEAQYDRDGGDLHLLDNKNFRASRMTTIEESRELVSGSKGNKKKFLIFTIVPLMLLTAIVFTLFVLNDGAKGDPNKDALTLSSIVDGHFERHSPVFNGTWISDTEIIMKDFTDNLVLYDVSIGKSHVLLPHSTQKISSGIQYELSADRNFIMIASSFTRLYRYSFYARYHIYDIKENSFNSINNLTSGEPLELQLVQWAPKGNAFAYVYQSNIYYRSSALDTKEIQITDDGEYQSIVNGVPDWVYEEEVFSSNSAIWFSPDGQNLAFAKFNDEDVPIMTLPYYGPPNSLNNQYPHPVTIRYPKAGHPNPNVTLHVVNLKNGKQQDVYTLRPPTDYLNQRAILSVVLWRDSSSLIAIWLNRVQNSSRILLCNTESEKLLRNGLCDELFQFEERGGWIELEKPPQISADGKHMLLILPEGDFTGLDSYPHIVRLSIVNKTEPPLVITQGQFTVSSILAWDSTNNEVFYTATLPHHPEQLHLFKSVIIEGSRSPTKEPECLSCKLKTSGDKFCSYVSATPSHNTSYFSVTCAGPGVPEAFLYDRKAGHFLSWENNEEVREKVKGVPLPTVTFLRVPVDNSGMRAQVKLVLPHNFDASGNTKYPLLVNVYGGPKAALAVDVFKFDWNAYLAINKSVVIAYIDGRNSGLKGMKMLFAGYRRLGTVEVWDQINVTRYLQNNLPYIDKSRSAIWGWSYGGYATAMALAQDHSNVFKCGISVAPVTDWLYYDSIYTERYMGLPKINDNAKGYLGASIMNKADNLRNKKFLLIHGTLDDNVHYQQSMMLSRELEQKDILFRQQTYPDEEHGLTGVRLHLYHTLTNFISECFELN